VRLSRAVAVQQSTAHGGAHGGAGSGRRRRKLQRRGVFVVIEASGCNLEGGLVRSRLFWGTW